MSDFRLPKIGGSSRSSDSVKLLSSLSVEKDLAEDFLGYCVGEETQIPTAVRQAIKFWVQQKKEGNAPFVPKDKWELKEPTKRGGGRKKKDNQQPQALFYFYKYYCSMFKIQFEISKYASLKGILFLYLSL